MQISVIAHNIRSVHNVGSLFRTCDGLGVEHLYICGYTPYPKLKDDSRLPHIRERLHAQIHKTALGAEQTVAFSFQHDIEQLLEGLKHTHTILALEQAKDSIKLPFFDTAGMDRVVLLLGEEVDGIPPAILEKCHYTLEIPMYGSKESFNVSVAAAIALYSLKERPTMLQS